MISQSDLKGFTGTENYYRHTGLLLTDGVKYFIEKCQCHWLVSDIGVVYMMEKNIVKNRQDGNSFLIIKLSIDKHQNKAILTIREDTNTPILYTQEYEYTDIKKYYSDLEIKFYLIDGVLLLEGEY